MFSDSYRHGLVITPFNDPILAEYWRHDDNLVSDTHVITWNLG